MPLNSIVKKNIMLQYILKIPRDEIIMMKSKHSDQICFQRVRFITAPRGRENHTGLEINFFVREPAGD